MKLFTQISPWTTRTAQTAPEDPYLEAVRSNDMETVRRMVGEAAKAAGYSIGPVWHGTDAPIKGNVFDENMRGTSTPDASAKEGFFFSDSKSEAQVYANEAVWKKKLDTYKPGGKNGMVLPFYLKIDSPERVGYASSTREELLRKARESGKDGVIDERGDFVVFKPQQIKSADPVTLRDPNKTSTPDNIIPISERFDSLNPDIRY